MKYPILGFLTERPMHGYELKAALSPALPREQRVNDGVLYPLLRRLESEGLIRGRRERGSGGRERVVYRRPLAAGASSRPGSSRMRTSTTRSPMTSWSGIRS